MTEIVIAAERPDTRDAMALIAELEVALSRGYTPEQRFGFSVEKLIAQGVAFFVLRADDAAAACGGVLLEADNTAEVKRMFVRDAYRGRGYAKAILDHLVTYARQHGTRLLRLETGIYQPEAIGLYERYGFTRIPPFGTYVGSETSVCYELVIG